MWVEFKINGLIENGKIYFTHSLDDNTKVYAFSDVPHLFKNIKNRLHDKKVLRVNPDGNSIKWSHYISVFNADIVHAGVSRAVLKNTKEHLFLSNIMQMRVQVMTQVFSHNIALRHFKLC